ncbi:MAG: PD-(D/E)XK motif protein [Flavobacteriales bacterium]|nr:PD-(D/E)XK motif protein [Flavobacteriales bacterium]
MYGELVILRQLLDHHSNHPAIWDCWRGPYSDNHDFSMNGVALEVKSSVASSPIMHISNELQLDMTGWTVLVLCLVHLNEARGSDRTLSSLIHELIERGAGRPAIQQTFRSKLGKIGVEQRHYELFTELGYEVRSTSFYGVTDGFPSIRRSSLSNSVKKVTYELIPAGVDSFQIDRGSAMNHFLPS